MTPRTLALALCLLPAAALADFRVFNGSADAGVANAIKCGSGVTCSRSGNVLTLSSDGGTGGLPWDGGVNQHNLLSATHGDTTASSPTDDNTLVGSGSKWTATALPSCTATGTALNYSTGGNAFSCNTVDFNQSTLPYTRSNIRRQGWYWLSCRGSGVFNSVGVQAFGVTGTAAVDATTSTRCWYDLHSAAGANAEAVLSSVGSQDVHWNHSPRFTSTVRVDSAGIGLASERIWVGIFSLTPLAGDSPGAGNLNWYMGFRYSTTVPDTNWQCCVGRGDTTADHCVDSGVPVTSLGEYVLDGYLDSNSATATFRINYSQVCSFTHAAMPTGDTNPGAPVMGLRTLNAVSRYIGMGFYGLENDD